MSCQKYVLKKDLKPIVLKQSNKLPCIISSTSPYSGFKLSFTRTCPKTEKKEKNLKRVTKSLNNYSRLKKIKANSFPKRNIFNSSYIRPRHSGTPCSNLRYLEEISEEIDEKNTMETPSDSFKTSNNPLTDIITQQYERYLYRPYEPDMVSKKRSFTPIFQKKISNKTHVDFSETPPDFSKVLH